MRRLLRFALRLVKRCRDFALQCPHRKPQVAVRVRELEVHCVAHRVHVPEVARAVYPRRLVRDIVFECDASVFAFSGRREQLLRLFAALRLEVTGERGELAALKLLLKAVCRSDIGGRNHDLAAGDRLRRLEPRYLRIDEGGLAEHRIELAVVCADYGAAEVLRALPGRSAVEKRSDLERFWPRDAHRLRLKEPSNVEAAVVHDVPFALVRADHEDVAERTRELRRSDDVVCGTDKPALRGRRGMSAMHADIAARNSEEALAICNVIARRV